MVESRACPPIEVIWLHFKLLNFLVSIPWSNIISVRSQLKFGITVYPILRYISELYIRKYLLRNYVSVSFELKFVILNSSHQLLFCICDSQLNSTWHYIVSKAYSVFANKPLPQEVIEFNSSVSLPSALSTVHQIFDVDTV